jgi:hypothetical protein
MALGATQDHKDSAVLVEADLKELAESLGQILRFAQDDKHGEGRPQRWRSSISSPAQMLIQHE